MEKHQKSSRCKLYAKTKELERVSSDLRIMCGNVEKLQNALNSLGKDVQPHSPDMEMRNNMEKIMNKLQEIWDLVKHETRELHSSESQPLANVSSVSAIRTTDNSPILESSHATQTSVQESQPVSPLSPADRVSLMRTELKEYLKHARPSVIKLAESRQVPHLIELFSKLASSETNEDEHVSLPISQKIIPILEQQADDIVQTLQQVSDMENMIRRSETIENAMIYKIVPSDDLSGEEMLIKRGVEIQPENISSVIQKTDVSMIYSEEKMPISAINMERCPDQIVKPTLLTITSQNEEILQGTKSPEIMNIEKSRGFCDIGIQTTSVTKRRKPHSAKVLGNYHLH